MGVALRRRGRVPARTGGRSRPAAAGRRVGAAARPIVVLGRRRAGRLRPGVGPFRGAHPGWRPRTRVDITIASGAVVTRDHADGVFSLTGGGHLLIPASVRRLLRWPTAWRLRLVAVPERGELVIDTMSVSDAMFPRCDSPPGVGTESSESDARRPALDAARLVLDRMGLTIEDLANAEAVRAPAPTFSECIPRVADPVTPGTCQSGNTFHLI